MCQVLFLFRNIVQERIAIVVDACQSPNMLVIGVIVFFCVLELILFIVVPLLLALLLLLLIVVCLVLLLFLAAVCLVKLRVLKRIVNIRR